MFSSKHRIGFSKTDNSILQRVKLYALVSQPDTIEYKDSNWYSNGEPAILVYANGHNYGLSKKYQNFIFYITIDGKFYQNYSWRSPYEKEERVYDIDFEIKPVQKSYGHNYKMSVTPSYHGRKYGPSFAGKMLPLGRGVKIYDQGNGTIKIEWTSELTEAEEQIVRE